MTHRVVDPAEVEPEPFPESGVHHRKLTESLGCRQLRANTVTLRPGEATTPHAHERQEEVYVARDGGRLVVDDAIHDLPAGAVARIDADAVRSIRNDTDDETHVWYLFGAPPVGSVDDFGEYVLPDDEPLAE